MSFYGKRSLALVIVIVFVTLLASPVRPAVVDVAGGGFTLRLSEQIAAKPDAVYATLIEPARWWSPEHTFSGDARNLTFDARAGGCWCERLPGGGSAVHMTVAYAQPGKLLRLRGALGPFQGSAVDGAMTWALKAAGSGTEVILTYTLGGYSSDGFAQWSRAADGVLKAQLARLKRLIETASPEAR